MSFWEGVFTNKAIILPLVSWLMAQVYKFGFHLIVNKKIDFKKLVSSGGMPSSHSAISVCLASVLGMKYGFDSGYFALAVILAFVVMADAAGVRRAAGKQAEVLNRLVNSSRQLHLEKDLKELLGHTPVQVFIGAALGIVIAVIFA